MERNQMNHDRTATAVPATGKAKRKRRWWIFAIFLWLPLTLTGGGIVLTNAGVCISQQRYWTDRELIEVAARALSRRAYLDGHGGSVRVMNIGSTEADIQKFLRDNPQCCSVNRHPAQRGFLEIIFGFNMPWVEINYEMSAGARRSNPHQYYQQYIAVSTCGEVGKFTAGTSTPTLESAAVFQK